MTNLSRRSAAKTLGLAAFGAAPLTVPRHEVTLVDPVVALWIETQSLNKRHRQISDQQNELRLLIESRKPGKTVGVTFADWHRDDPDLSECTALRELSDKLSLQSLDLYDQISDAAAVTPEGIRAKAAAALSIWVQETSIRDEMACYDLILNALREAAAGSAV
ncbi:hypothetical protein ACELLULO517_27455 [Acidisoma cellulosilytica]|uniref:Uncharacterized protein n=1 Tax=Acidisoma cellulosilyticum TaxID=2802395 RepID=A0A963Z703_9PROT|nr:hypothetical protein [Acidisoma cellulosilyticum]MCB8884005.1 hypothetical protein [Acidisoma cellulosilyticum]